MRVLFLRRKASMFSPCSALHLLFSVVIPSRIKLPSTHCRNFLSLRMSDKLSEVES